MWCLGSSLFFLSSSPPPPPPPPDLALFAPDCRCMAHRASPFLFFLPYWLYFPPRGGPLGEAPRSSCFWSVCSPRGRNGADSLIPDDVVFAFALFCLFFLLFSVTAYQGAFGRREQDGREAWDGWRGFVQPPRVLALALRYKEWGWGLYTYTQYIGPGGSLFSSSGCLLFPLLA